MNDLHHLSPAWTHLTRMQPVRAEGIYYYDADDNQWIDFTAGIGVVNTGHCHPRVVKAIQEQAAKLIHGQINTVISPQAVACVNELNTITPDHIDCFFLSNSGAEATEGAVKLAKQATGRTNVITFQGSFHGRTALTMSMTNSKTIYRAGYQPLPPGTFVAPFPYVCGYRGMSEDHVIDFCMDQLKLLLKSQTAPHETAALVIEPVLGEGGYIPAPPRFMQEARELCREHGILFIADEVQSGFGRTGTMFCFEQSNIDPDIVIMAKGIGSGFPISAIGASRELMEKWTPGSHGGTYGGNALAAATAVETIRVIKDEKLPENAAAMGEYLTARLRDVQQQFPLIGDVRGPGLMVGVEFRDENHNPLPDVMKAVLHGCLDRRLMLLSCGSYGNTLRWIPPLIVTQEQIDTAVDLFAEAVAQAVGIAEPAPGD
ncbi:MAG: aminotransferase class III-fold pyridoxal phosphate-dependent enzyme [Chloroflexota bacterium]